MATRSAPRRWLVLVAIWAIPGILTTSQMYLLSAAIKNDGDTLWQIFVAKFPPWQMWALATPLIVHVRRRYPFDRAGWWRAVAAHLPLWAVLAVADTSLNYAFGRLAEQPPYSTYSAASMLPPMLIKGAFFELFIYAAVLAVDFGLEYHDRYRASALRQSQLEAKLVETHLDALKAQLRPHFLFNTLNAISVLARKGETAGAVKMIDGLGDLLRRSLTTARVELVTLDEELDFIQRYLDIATTRFSDRLRARIDVGPAARAARVPCLLLQPIVENAIEHGLAPRASGGQLEIVAWIERDVLRIEIRDDGVGLSAAPRYGVGLAHVRDRLAQLYPQRHRFALEPRSPAGTVAVLELPVEVA
jgi:signal transduction histidine kinase